MSCLRYALLSMLCLASQYALAMEYPFSDDQKDIIEEGYSSESSFDIDKQSMHESSLEYSSEGYSTDGSNPNFLLRNINQIQIATQENVEQKDGDNDRTEKLITTPFKNNACSSLKQLCKQQILLNPIFTEKHQQTLNQDLIGFLQEKNIYHPLMVQSNLLDFTAITSQASKPFFMHLSINDEVINQDTKHSKQLVLIAKDINNTDYSVKNIITLDNTFATNSYKRNVLSFRFNEHEKIAFYAFITSAPKYYDLSNNSEFAINNHDDLELYKKQPSQHNFFWLKNNYNYPILIELYTRSKIISDSQTYCVYLLPQQILPIAQFDSDKLSVKVTAYPIEQELEQPLLFDGLSLKKLNGNSYYLELIEQNNKLSIKTIVYK